MLACFINQPHLAEAQRDFLATLNVPGQDRDSTTDAVGRDDVLNRGQTVRRDRWYIQRVKVP